MQRSRFVVATFVCFLLAFPLPLRANARFVTDFTKDAPVTYTVSFTLNATPAVWNRLLDNPVFVMRLWNVYGFPPRYRVSMSHGLLHVIDPKGLEGDLFELPTVDGKRVFYCIGKMNHPLVPLKLTGKIMILIESRAVPNGLSVSVRLYCRGNSIGMNTGLAALSPLLGYLIEDRASRHIHDIGVLVNLLMTDPDSVRSKIGMKYANDLNRIVKQ